MSRPVVVDEQRILSVARELFLERGIGATTSELAERAGVSEGSIFKRFPSKSSLFHAAMFAGEAPEWLQRVSERVGRSTLERELAELCREVLEFFRKIVPLSMMAWSDPATRKSALEDDKPLPVECHFKLARYFESEMELGRLRRVDASALTRTLSGALWSYVAMETFFGTERARLAPEREFVRSLVDIVLFGAAASAPAGRPAPRRRKKVSNTRRATTTRKVSS